MFTLLKLGLRYNQKHLLQSLLLILGVALGVAVIIAIDLANLSATKAFQLSSQTLTGKTTHQISGIKKDIDEELFRKIRIDLKIKNSAPIVQDYINISIDSKSKSLRLFGIDPFSETPFRNYVGGENSNIPIESLTSFFIEPNTVLIEESFAKENNLNINSNFDIEYSGKKKKLKVVGLIKANDDLSKQALSGMIISDISTAQEVLNKVGKLSSIDLILNEEDNKDLDRINKIKEILPKGINIESPKTRSSALEQMSDAFKLNLSALSLLALVVGMFLIYNTVTFSVVQRRGLLGILRALGVTKSQVFSMIVLETSILAIIGTIIGLFLGIFLGQGALYLVTRTINDLYFTLNTSNVQISEFTLLKGAFIGIFASIFASSIPAFEATRVPPSGTLKRSNLENTIQKLLPYISSTGILFGLIGLIFLYIPTKRIEISFIGLFTIILGASLLVPILTNLLMKIFSHLATIILGVVGKLAPRNINRSLSRTTVAIAALMVAVSVIVGVSIMIGSFRQTVVSWLETTLTADIFISSANSSGGISNSVANDLTNKISTLENVKSIATARSIRLQTNNYGFVLLTSISNDIAQNRKFVWTDGDKNSVWNKVKSGNVLISESFAFHNNIKSELNNKIKLETPQGNKEFKIAGIYYDYSSDRGTILMESKNYQSIWQDKQINSIAVFTKESKNTNALINNIQNKFNKNGDLLVQSNKLLKESALEVFDRTFAITDALRLLAAIVAFIGVFSTLMSLQLERIKEFGIMRATGMTIGQIQSLILLETGLMGLSAGLIAMPVGIILALILIHVINLRSFGWSLELILIPDYFIQAILISVIASLLAGIYPSIKIKNIQVANAIRNE
ncbi:MAG: FtsX-like permease family protein [Candidatus Sericytochromatia bacterium]